MAKDIIVPQDLLIYRNILQTSLSQISNEMYANNNKITFKAEFTFIVKSNAPIAFKVTTNPVYQFKIIVIDKTNNPIGIYIPLYHNYYVKEVKDTIFTIERKAIQDWFTNGCKALYNIIQEDYTKRKEEENRITNERLAKGITLETIQASIKENDKQRILEQEEAVIRMLHPNLK